MSIRVLRKALGLLMADIVIIIGIFVLQFRTDSNIIEKIENLQFTFVRSENSESINDIKNKVNIVYNGINFFCDDQHPALVMTSDSKSKPVQLISWERTDELSCKLNFSDNVSVIFELASQEQNASLAIVLELPSGIEKFSLPYSFSSNMKIYKDEGKRVIMNGRKNMWEVSADSLSSGYFGLSTRDYIATYAVYDETKKFTFDLVVDLDIANEEIYRQNVEKVKTNLINAFKNNNSESNLTEQIIVSYIAAQAENGQFIDAVESIPSNYKKNKQRTYLSAPYLNTLEDMNAILEKTIKDTEKKISDAALVNSLDIFTIHNIANFMYVHSNQDSVKNLLQSTAFALPDAISISQAVGILNAFTDMSELNKEYAQYLLPVIEKCINRITNSCSFEGNILTISDNDTFYSVIQAVETGIALLRYGKISGNHTLEKAGYVLVNSYMAESTSFDLRTLSNLYSILAYDNPYYPHFKKIIDDNNQKIWAWTCANNIEWKYNSDETSSLVIDFPEGATHYVIFKGIPQFTTIYIYNMAFRTDPRFETYNSSGYVYKTNTKTLLLKSRHKSNPEIVSFDYASSVEKTKNVTPTINETVSISNETSTENDIDLTANNENQNSLTESDSSTQENVSNNEESNIESTLKEQSDEKNIDSTNVIEEQPNDNKRNRRRR